MARLKAKKGGKDTHTHTLSLSLKHKHTHTHTHGESAAGHIFEGEAARGRLLAVMVDSAFNVGE